MPKYVVSGPFGFRGNPPGSRFEAQPDPVIERALSRGSISEDTAPNHPPAKPNGLADPKSKEEK